MRFRAAVTVVMLLALVACGGVKKKGRAKAPYFSLEDLTGNTVTIEAFRGRPFLLVFWATWCPACRSEVPTLNRLTKEGLTVVAVAMNRSKEEVKEFVKEHHIHYQVLMGTYQVTIDYGNVRFLPTMFLIDAKGYIEEKMVGQLDEERIGRFLKGK